MKWCEDVASSQKKLGPPSIPWNLAPILQHCRPTMLPMLFSRIRALFPLHACAACAHEWAYLTTSPRRTRFTHTHTTRYLAPSDTLSLKCSLASLLVWGVTQTHNTCLWDNKTHQQNHSRDDSVWQTFSQYAKGVSMYLNVHKNTHKTFHVQPNIAR